MELLYRYGVIMNHKKVTRIMNKYSLVCKIRRVKRYGNTFEEKHIENTFENRLNTVKSLDLSFVNRDRRINVKKRSMCR